MIPLWAIDRKVLPGPDKVNNWCLRPLKTQKDLGIRQAVSDKTVFFYNIETTLKKLEIFQNDYSDVLCYQRHQIYW